MIIVALDFDDIIKVEDFLKNFTSPIYVKVGMELFYAEGSEIIKVIKKYNHKIFLDLKLHDIPMTVKKALKVIDKMDIDMVNVHAKGGSEMLTCARSSITSAKLIAVTELTSTNDAQLQEMCDLNVKESVMCLVALVNNAKLDGVVCSAQEAKMIKELYPNLITVCPGIRMNAENNDQKRVMHPKDAKDNMVDYMVVGREITLSSSPKKIYDEILGAYND